MNQPERQQSWSWDRELPRLCTSTKEATFTEVDRSRTDSDQGFHRNSTRGKNCAFQANLFELFCDFGRICVLMHCQKYAFIHLSTSLFSPKPKASTQNGNCLPTEQDRTSFPLLRSIVHSMYVDVLHMEYWVQSCASVAGNLGAGCATSIRNLIPSLYRVLHNDGLSSALSTMHATGASSQLQLTHTMVGLCNFGSLIQERHEPTRRWFV